MKRTQQFAAAAFVFALFGCGGGGSGAAAPATGGSVSTSSASSSTASSAAASLNIYASASFTNLALLAGQPVNLNKLDGAGATAMFTDIAGLIADASGNVLITETRRNYSTTIALRKMSREGAVSTLSTSLRTARSDEWSLPYRAAVDAAGNVYFADPQLYVIKKRTAAGVTTVIAGTSGQYGSANGTAAVARFSAPGPVTLDGAGNLYVGELQGRVVRKITPDGVVSTLAGVWGAAGSFDSVENIAADTAGNVYVAGASKVSKVTPAGVVTTLAGSASAGHADGTGSAASFTALAGIAVDAAGNVYVADSDRIRKVTLEGVVSSIAGGGTALGEGAAALSAKMSALNNIAVDIYGDIYFTEWGLPRVRKVTTTGLVLTIAGPPDGNANAVDGQAGVARFYVPVGMAADASGNLYVADQYNHLIRKITADGTTTIYAGTPGLASMVNGERLNAAFNKPTDLAFDASGNLYVTDTGNSLVRKISAAGVVSTFAGSGLISSANGPAASAAFNGLYGIRVDGAGNVYVSCMDDYTIRKISGGVVSTFAGSAGIGGAVDGSAAVARFNMPAGIAFDANGNLYVADSGNNKIRKISPSGLVSTFAGSGSSGAADGKSSIASFLQPQGISVDAAGNVFVADGYGLIRKATQAGEVSTVLGRTSDTSGATFGPVSSATLSSPLGVLVMPDGQLAISVQDAVLKTK